eukprot:SAG22_NODE_191_length_15699_cov_19.660192_12_plen_68_part_00
MIDGPDRQLGGHGPATCSRPAPAQAGARVGCCRAGNKTSQPARTCFLVLVWSCPGGAKTLAGPALTS